MDISKLEEKLGELRGLDFERAEMEERAAGNQYPDLTFTKSFQVRLAALALGVPSADIKELPLKKYVDVCNTVSRFLFQPSVDETPVEK